MDGSMFQWAVLIRAFDYLPCEVWALQILGAVVGHTTAERDRSIDEEDERLGNEITPYRLHAPEAFVFARFM